MAFKCSCKVGIDKHTLDWYGQTDGHAEWRRKVLETFCSTMCKILFEHGNVHKIQDFATPPRPIASPKAIQNRSAYPTEARLRQKERLKKDKADGIKPKKRPKIVEEGNDDCGDDISGLGSDAVLLSRDMVLEIDSDDDNTELFQMIPHPLNDGTFTYNVFSAVASLCYGKSNKVDLVEFCGGAGRISQVAFRRNLESGGNLDLTTQCDLGDPTTQRAINHYLKTCHVLVAILQPNCRTVGRPSYFNAQVNPETWYKHHKEDRPHLKYCGEVAPLQMHLGRYFLREQPAGTWIDHI